ncbi:CvfD/Ygs/GSP13 family RNA-binding post-transcriptional regulator [Levilactobacillus zymae]|uniref:General stress protein n=1 Tax=Levilactobacillus zymae TaxID=267363 RepID=A0A1Y6JXH2_9LACO|nr:CvfD/Ygs/GSP13 family RNA-binding post-transcriptional regulator [Levilactobacillus zymae]KRL10721.1 RNA-binding protein [Levilactobacillus zymae DSM 19395]QFR60392.1 S1 RNA-binding domain-containing protein [Levilactobacillus zymae]GEO71152.1 general stress protein [Levilactobacillus zymae]SMS14565.1 SSU ribosomal protein S1p [Levilactobacillus zymae]
MTFKIGQRVSGRVTGIQPYGAFVSLGGHRQGLIHISECHCGYVKDIHDYLKVNQEVNVVVLDIDEFTGKISLSLRCLERLDTETVPSEHQRHHYWTNHRVAIGFKPIADRLAGWKAEATQRLNDQQTAR